MIFFYPNRPVLVPPDPHSPLKPSPDYINSLEASGKYVAEQKWNGDNVQIIREKGKTIFYNRRKELHRYQPTKEVAEELNRWPETCMLNAELLHYKTTAIKNTLIVHCIMNWEGKYLMKKTWGDSRNILNKCIDKGLSGIHVKISPIWKSCFWKLFSDADGKIIEGIILKDPKGIIQFQASMIKDVSWMLKIRKPCNKYSF